jgi:hypothetical protein
MRLHQEQGRQGLATGRGESFSENQRRVQVLSLPFVSCATLPRLSFRTWKMGLTLPS